MKLIIQTILAALCLSAHASHAEQVDFKISETLNAGDFELPYTLDMELNAVAPTRVSVDALLDLRDIQTILPERLADSALIDNCGVQVKLDDLSILASDNVITLESLLGVKRFDCGRVSQQDFRRGNELGAFSAILSADVSVELKDNCAYLKIPDLTLASPEATRDGLLKENTLSEAKSFLLAAIDLVLSETPLCPELPEELASLDPSYDTGGPREIDDGGLGVSLSGSLDVSPSTIIDILIALQRGGKIPPSP